MPQDKSDNHIPSLAPSAIPPINPSAPDWVRTHLLETYLAHIRGSLGSAAYRHWYVHQNKTPETIKDVTNAGQRSCAYFASAVLVTFDLTYKVLASTNGLLRDMWGHGWNEIKDPRPGAVLVWMPQVAQTGTYPHIGFYMGEDIAISHVGGDMCAPIEHDWRYVPPKSDQRELHSIWWHDNLV